MNTLKKLFATVALFGALAAPTANAAENKLPASMLGTWCGVSHDDVDGSSDYNRGKCRNGEEEAAEIVVSPRSLEMFEGSLQGHEHTVRDKESAR